MKNMIIEELEVRDKLWPMYIPTGKVKLTIPRECFSKFGGTINVLKLKDYLSNYDNIIELEYDRG